MAGGKRIFSYQEALGTFPEVRQLTAAAVGEVQALVNRIQSLDDATSRRPQLETAYQAIVERWAEQVTALGCEVKGVWLVDWDNGDGYYCWRYPEESLAHFHGYEEGFRGRVPIQ